MPLNNIKHISNSTFLPESLDHSIDWLNWAVILASLFFIISSRISDYTYIPGLFKRQNNYNSSQVTLKKFSSIALILNYFLTTSLFLWHYLILKDFNFFSTSVLFILIFGGLILISGLKFLIIYTIDLIFKRKVHFHINLHLTYFQIIGLILIPLYILSYFSSDQTKLITYAVVGLIFCSTLIIRELKSLFTALTNRISLLYIILYLCTLEILPLILAIKILKG